MTYIDTGRTNYEESRVGSYTLPDPLRMMDGTLVTDPQVWFDRRRLEILELYRLSVYGRSPTPPWPTCHGAAEIDRAALGGGAIRKQIVGRFDMPTASPLLHVLLYTPREARRPSPVFLCLCFAANHAVTEDPGVRLNEVWDRQRREKRNPTESERGTGSFCRIEQVIARGYGIAFLCYGDIEPDFADGSGCHHGLRSLFARAQDIHPAGDQWGAIAVWAWGLSRALDLLVEDADVDPERIIALGHSRLGKTSLWAAAEDQRFAAVIASCSGEMGAALARRDYGETVDDMIRNFPYQFCPNFRSFSGRWDAMPVDAHMLLTLVAPRPLFLSTGAQDQWSDPRGEFLAAVAAGPVYRLLGKQDMGSEMMPPVDTPILSSLSYQCHSGGHDILLEDWDRFLDFADRHFGPSPGPGRTAAYRATNWRS